MNLSKGRPDIYIETKKDKGHESNFVLPLEPDDVNYEDKT
jgi:hypothetical protein